jgi:hypothetical protein
MLCSSRLPTIRFCLLILAVALLSAGAGGPSALGDPARAATSGVVPVRAGVHVAARDSRHRAGGAKPSSSTAGCTTRERKHRGGSGCTKEFAKAVVPKPKNSTNARVPATGATIPAGSEPIATMPAPVSESSTIEPTPIVEPAKPSGPAPAAPASAPESTKPSGPAQPSEPVTTPSEPAAPTEPVAKEPTPPAKSTPIGEPEPVPISEPSPIEPAPIVEPIQPTEPVPKAEEPTASSESVTLSEPAPRVEESAPAKPIETAPEQLAPTESLATEKLSTPTLEGQTQTVEKKTATTISVSSSSNPSMLGEAITYTATVSPVAATGMVEFKQAEVTIAGCAAQTVSAGAATCTVTGLAAGGHWVTAVYSGSSNYGVSTSSGFTQTVKKEATVTTVSSSLNPSTVGQAVSYTATVSPAAAGTVEFKQAGVAIAGCATQVISAGKATCAVANPTAGGHWITAVYSGDSSYEASSFPGFTQTVNRKTTAMTVSSSLNPSAVGETVTYTATVSPAVATGTVEFKQAGVTVSGCSSQPVSSGAATCTVAGLAAGGHWVTAVYSGDSDYSGSIFSGFTQTVKEKTTTTTVASSLNPSIVGQAVTYTAVVSPAVATGTVEFKQAGVIISGCSAQVVSAGVAACTVTNLTAGGHWITAVYSGDSSYGGSSFSGFSQTVNKKTTITTVSSLPSPSTVGQAVTYAATISPVAATGTVEFKEEGAPIAGCTAQTVSSGTATCTVKGYPTWSSYTITAAYGGDGSDLASVSSKFTQTVEPPIESTAPFRFFSPTGFWNEEVPASTPLDPSSAEVVGALDAEVAEEAEVKTGPAINTTSWSVPVYTVLAEQPTVKVVLESASQNSTLQAAWDAVPLPPNAQPAEGTDKHLVVWQPSTNKLWEFWRLEKTEAGWGAAWGGAMQNASSDPGAYGPEAWPGATTGWGASASSLSIAGGLITLEDLERGQINHALAISVPNTRGPAFASPAQRTDGWHTEASSLPEGAHLRLEPGLNLASLHLPRFTLMLAEAAQKYGIFVRDSAANVAFYAQDPIPTGANPYTGAHGYFEDKSPPQLLATFPWSHLQLLKMELHG